MKSVFPSEWRTQSRWKRRFYSRYMRTLERAGYVLVTGVFAAVIFAFNYAVEDIVTAEKVAIEPFSVPIESIEPVRVTSYLVQDLQDVQKGQPLMQVVRGAQAVERYAAWEAVDALRQKVGENDEIRRLLATFPRPALDVVTAPVSGVFRKGAEPPAQGEPLARIVNYSDLRLSASLGGPTVAEARVGQAARITSIAVEPVAGVLFRGTDSISGSVLGDELKAAVSAGLVGRSVRLRDDIPLIVTEVTEIQVDAATRFGAATEAKDAVPLDPAGTVVVQAEVLSGTPMATVQVADLPANVLQSAREVALSKLTDRPVRRVDGTVATIAKAEDLRFLVKLKAGPEPTGTAQEMPGTMVSRSFDAGVRLKQPPEFLIDAVRRADASGRKVTARVEMVTGARPIALRLLKKS